MELHEGSVKWGLVARGYRYTRVQMHGGSVTWGFICKVVESQGEFIYKGSSVTRGVQLHGEFSCTGVQLQGGSVTRWFSCNGTKINWYAGIF